MRVGIIINALMIPAWISQVVKNIITSNHSEMALVIVVHAKDKDYSKNRYKAPLLLRLYQKFDNRYFKPEPNALRLVNSEELLVGTTIINIEFDEIESYLPKIKEHSLDLIVSFLPDAINQKITQAAKFGILSPDISDTNMKLITFEEVIDCVPTTKVASIIYNYHSKVLIVNEAYIATDPISVKRNRNNFLWKNSALILRAIKNISTQREDYWKSLSNKKNSYDQIQNTVITSQNICKFFVNVIKRKLLHLFYFEQWILLYGKDSFPFKSVNKFKKLLPPKDRFWADPHIIFENGTYYLFIEESVYGQKGHISVTTMNADGKHAQPIPILKRPYHLSYPFVFKFDGTYFMIPETMENKTIEVYKCLEFPYKWEFHKNLFENLQAVDTTLFYHNSKWWLFTVISEYEGETTWDELFLFYADNPLTDNWIPHPKNPIVSDVRLARPAGKIFQVNGNIIRPSQNSSKGYGYSITLNQVKLLNETDYKEEPIGSIEPGWNDHIKGIHSLDFEKDLTVIDAKYKTLKLS